MAALTNKELLDHNSDIESRVTSDTEIITIVSRIYFDKLVDVEEYLLHSLDGTMKKLGDESKEKGLTLEESTIHKYWPKGIFYKSINNIPVSKADLVGRKDHVPSFSNPGETIIEVTMQHLVYKPVNISAIEDCIDHMLMSGNVGMDPLVQKTFVTNDITLLCRVIDIQYI